MDSVVADLTSVGESNLKESVVPGLAPDSVGTIVANEGEEVVGTSNNLGGVCGER